MFSDQPSVDLIVRLHAAPHRAVIAVTGGGGRALGALLSVPGASQTVLESVVPYSSPALVEFLGLPPEQFCSEPTARAMAMAAYRRAERWRQAELADSADPWPVVGIGLTASLASDRPKRGAHRIHVAVQSDGATRSRSVELVKGARSRDAEEDLAAALLLNLLAASCGLPESFAATLTSEEHVVETRSEASPAWQDLMAGRCDRVAAGDEAREARSAAVGVFPGSFHPLHDGHRRMHALAQERLGGPVDFEISIENVGKLPLDYVDMAQRAAQFAPDELYFTRAPRMVQKARLFPGRTIVCGLDTITRVADVRFADDSEAVRDAIVAEIAQLGCRFLVFGRTTGGRFQTLDDLDLPPALRAICDGVGEAEFRADVSSTELRKKAE